MKPSQAVAQQNTEWHRRMTSERLNQTGKPISQTEIPPGSQVYFFKPPTQAQALKHRRIAVRTVLLLLCAAQQRRKRGGVATPENSDGEKEVWQL